MPFVESLGAGVGAVVAGVTGTLVAVAENAANGGPFNPQGEQPPFGSNDSGMDAGGGWPTGGFNPRPCSARSGIGGRGQPANDCMTLFELNSCVDEDKPGAAPGDERGLCWTCLAGQWIQI